jgi:hypothetical protein
MTTPDADQRQEYRESRRDNAADSVCPVCGGALQQESCKVVCRSETCVYRIVFNCSEF